MNPVIFMFPTSDQININESKLVYDSQPSPKLIKYGFNNINEELDILSLTSNPYYRVGLNFDFERNDENSIVSIASKFFNYDGFNKKYAELWEIINNFKLLDNSNNIATSHPEIVTNISINYNKLRDKNYKHQIFGLDTNKKCNLVIDRFSDVDVEENAVVQYIINHLGNLLNKQLVGSNMVIQMFSTQTQTTAELIYYLSALYNQAYIMRPIISSDFSDEKYLVLLGLKEIPKLPDFLSSDNTYIISFGLNVPGNIMSIIQCLNSYIMPQKYIRYNKIKQYLDTKVYEGATYQDMINSQNKDTQNWMNTYTDLSNINNMLDKNIKFTSKNCLLESGLTDLLN
ncbi:divergent methyltransferase [Saudi moumouvirus]|uniref:Putative FtsJ-like methyl transferase n=1 Tax=Moumouvirus sp. 'Monve' TaxID=1128131 RepID=H2EEE0_9VIRU|nr:putative FtsJ-like methyl transferase [Moumouvirus Monve]AQN68340.1 divergent methyltransferase [Saudi moumouvirus]